MRIAIYGNPFNPVKAKYVQHLIYKLEENNVPIIIEHQFHDFLIDHVQFKKDIEIFDTPKELQENADILLSIGGDGTLLNTITLVRDSGIPVLGINTGRLGFISSVSTDQIDNAINQLFKKEYTLEKRTLLQLDTDNQLFGETNFALNEVTVLKKDTSSMIRIHAFLDDEFLNSYWADGLIVATPTGSTGYSLSCGGPIVVPGTENFIIAPIAPHNLNVRPVIVSEDRVLKLKVEDRDELALVALDSRSRAIDPTLELTIRKTDFKVNLIKLHSQSFIATIREKLMWGKDKRN
ncbi:MAG: NAD kinase [Flavobacteriales bacterium]|nr:NAD kinase [Flavobacteriales bacterium]